MVYVTMLYQHLRHTAMLQEPDAVPLTDESVLTQVDRII
jgi:hypothetical protein